MLQNSILQFWKQLVKKVQRDFFDKLNPLHRDKQPGISIEEK